MICQIVTFPFVVQNKSGRPSFGESMIMTNKNENCLLKTEVHQSKDAASRRAFSLSSTLFSKPFKGKDNYFIALLFDCKNIAPIRVAHV